MPIAMSTFSRFLRKPVLALSIGAVVCFQQGSSEQAQAGPLPSAAQQGPAQGRLRNHRPEAGNRITNRSDKVRLAAWTRTFRETYPDLPRAYYINEDLVQEILRQANPSNSPATKGGLRLYFGLDSSTNTPHAIVVAVRHDGTDVLEPSSTLARPSEPTGASLIIGESDDKCPSNCDTTSPLAQ